MTWIEKLGKDKEGSRPRCILLMDGDREDIAARLTKLVGLTDVSVTADDKWMPRGKSAPDEVELDKSDGLIPPEFQKKLQDWWLTVPATTPNWDIVSTCSITGNQGLILVEAKAHCKELKKRDSSKSGGANRKSIERALGEANRDLHLVTGGCWDLALAPRYQLSNRFAWSWKLASIGVPVVLVYLGFLNAYEMPDPFHDLSEWEKVLKNYGKDTVNNAVWGERLDIGDSQTPFIPLIRDYDQCFDPKNP